ncbi:hypothetical protein AA0112_g11855 [Alternaria arborescens]|uniref:Uncharacterized protein n=1 Tax=Alternaria tenuissima TaxID=119927 RepID=A0ABY0FXT1_9PLEO|nr:hypothetical protein AA0112_g11855 [Alternaria arborescens]RYN91020.1 hypothetical protein AA0119_g10837 [Alternaria tenuissima]RYO07687.1 hypothetical protein AA0121_g11659 [Alternaria tenuissima]RYO64410.1 hypothetical protein AA0116_g3010 [Alternaria tenuissima]
MSLIPVQLLVLSSLVLAQYNTSGLMDVKTTAIWEPKNIGSDADWANAIAEWKILMRRLDATDEGAGRLWQDARNPPSAQAL